MSEPIETRRRRLAHRSRYTGMKETDLLLGAFATRHIASLGDAELDAYERLLDEPDPAIFAWATGAEDVPEQHRTRVMDLLRSLKDIVQT